MATVRYQGVDYPIEPGHDLLGALLDQGVSIGYICMSGSCGTCRVHVESGGEHLAPPMPMERTHGCDGDERLACQAIVIDDGVITISQ